MYAVGRVEGVLPAVERFQQDLRNRCGLLLQWNKTEWFTWNGQLPDHVPAQLKLVGMQIDNEFYRGFICYGIPLGSDEFVRHQLQQKSQEIIDDSVRMVEVLSGKGRHFGPCSAYLQWQDTRTSVSLPHHPRVSLWGV